MPVFSYKIQNLVNGISTQPVAYRLANQAKSCTNFWPSVGAGLTRRPGSRYIETLLDEPLEDNTFSYTIDRAPLEKYLVLVRQSGQLLVFNLITGEACNVVNTVGDTAYITTSAPVDSLRAVTIGDQTIVVNREVTVSMSDETSPAGPDYALVWMKQMSASGEYKIIITDTSDNTVTYTSNVTTSGHKTVQEVIDDLTSKVNAGTFYTASYDGFVMKLMPAGRDIKAIGLEDPIAGTGMELVYLQVDTVADLPSIAPHNYTVRVRGDQNRNQDDFYVKFITADNLPDNTLGRGSWVETVAPSVPIRLNAASMPHALENTGFNQFTYRAIEWGNREVGDLESAEDPSFVGGKINGAAFWQGRLVLFSKDQVSMSETGAFFNFFPTTTLTLPDAERVDIQISVARSGDILHAIPYNSRLLLFARDVQFALFGDPVITPGNVSVYPVSYLPFDGAYNPKGLGRFVYFGHDQSEYFRTLEYFLETDGQTYNHVDISGHAHRYVPANIQDLSVSPDLEALCLTPKGDGDTLYFYKSFWQDNQKVQSAWFDFSLPGVTRVVASKFLRNVLYLVTVRLGRTCLETLEFTDDDTEPGFPWSPHMDLRLSQGDLTSATYDPVTEETTITSPAFYAGGLVWHLYTSDKRILLAPCQEAGTLVFPGDLTNETFFVGLPFVSSYVLPYLSLKVGEPPRPVDYLKYDHVLSVRVNYEDSMEFLVNQAQGAWGQVLTRVNPFRLQSEAPSDSWRLADGSSEVISGIRGGDLEIELESIGAFPMKPVSLSYNVRVTPYKETI